MSSLWRLRLVPILAFAVVAAFAGERAHAYSTRVHIWYANQIRAALIASGDNSITLKGSGGRVVLDPDDAYAIINEPESFRAGAIGPDNLMFPGQTDGTHAIGQRPYEQCEALYEDAVIPLERAYALGCFLHGVTDAIVHHYVNYMSGETFTLNPITAARASGFSNVIRHIVAEEMIQNAVLKANPQAFTASELAHTVPYGFVLRNYFDTAGNVYSILGHHESEHWAELKSANPTKTLPQLMGMTGFAPVQHLISIAIYVEEAQAFVTAFRNGLERDLTTMQGAGHQLKVKPGPDGRMGTFDDVTDCKITCPTVYANYMIRVALFLPRKDSFNQVLPSAFTVMREKLMRDIDRFPMALLGAIQNVSGKLNAPLSTPPTGYDIKESEVDSLFGPLTRWADDLTNLDYKALTYSVVPDSILKVDSLLSALGIDVAQIIKDILRPMIQPIIDEIKARIIEAAKAFLKQLAHELQQQLVPTQTEYQNRLVAAAAPSLNGKHMLDHWNQSGLFAHSFNIVAATFANHDVIVPFGVDDLGIGPASFDTSFTSNWSQAGLCPELRAAIFPYGLGVKGIMTVELAGTVHESIVPNDSPIECHDGSLSAFSTNPTVTNCAHTTLDVLTRSPHRGCLSRGYPPNLGAKQPKCENIVVPGLELDDAGGALTPGENGEDDETGVDDEALGTTQEVGSVGCSGGGDAGLVLLGLAALLFVLRRRSALLAALALGGCDMTLSGEAFAPMAPNEPLAEIEPQDEPALQDGIDPLDEIDPLDHVVKLAPMSPEEHELAAAAGGLTADQLMSALGNTVWSGVQNRYELGVYTSRAYEMRFKASENGWYEIRNPWGPGRFERYRGFDAMDDGRAVRSVVIQTNDGEFDELNGLEETYYFEIVAGTPRKLRVYGKDYAEEYSEGAFKTPVDGLTAVVRSFPTGPIEVAFCTSGLNSIRYADLFNWARGADEHCVAPGNCTPQPPLGEDAVAGARLMSQWDDTNNNQFAVTNVNGFENYGGTALSNQLNFIVWYRGWVVHPGGNIAVREEDDSVEDAVWVLLGNDVGSNSKSNLFLEVHGFLTPDGTSDEPSESFGAGNVPIEIFIVRCANDIETVQLDMKLGNGAWKKIGLQPTKPELLDEYFATPIFP